MEGLFFYLFATLAVIAALAMVTRRDPVTSAFWLIFCFLNVAALFATLEAHLIAVLQVLIYAGAIMVFFLFVTMFLGRTKRASSGTHTALIGFALLTAAALVALLGRVVGSSPRAFLAAPEGFGTIEGVSETLLRHYLLPFEVTGLLLTVAVIGAVLLARREAPGMRGSREEVELLERDASVGGGADA